MRKIQGTVVKSTGGMHFSMADYNPPEILLEVNKSNRLWSRLPNNQRIGVQPVELTFTANRVAVHFGNGQPTELGKAVTDFNAGKISFFGGDAGVQFGKLVFAGTIEETWLRALENE
jgi:hypothetical protein